MSTETHSKTVLVTGAATGIGKAIAEAFCNCGYNTVFADINLGEAAQNAKRFQHASAITLDVTQEADWQTATTEIVERYGSLNCVVNNAGIGLPLNIEEIDHEHWQTILNVNLTGTMWGCKYGVKLISQYGGSIVNIASVLGKRPVANVPAYGASKAGVINLTQSTALWCAEQNYPVRCNVILPGYIRTALMEKALSEAINPKELLKHFASLHPMNRLGTAEEIANAAVFLDSERASFITGSVLPVDGGNTI
ncbi:SDR family oxidoreductase [Shewanella corallii]|uniref:SDR family oxidoreductase n=1 Tax=Shewanella corallii TaxID=560080 RepID=A0ABT0NAJ2_9GAMM|nr:SDR family oxidoreductase [Shewanella corallii]MCL2915478.1 SDR family oxidoreductase [Shewanella corallii]